MVDPILITILAVLIIVFFVTSDRCRVQTINEQERQIDDLLMVAKMRDTYIAELQQRLERHSLDKEPVIVYLVPLQASVGDGNEFYGVERNGNAIFTIVENRN